MNWKNLFLIILLCLFANPSLYALKRENYGWCFYPDDDRQWFCSYCPEHTNWSDVFEFENCECEINIYKYKRKMNILKRFRNLIPRLNENCEFCRSKAIYMGYFDPFVNRYFLHFESYLTYVNDHKECSCYWPELSREAAKISDLAFDLFHDLVLNTKLCHIHEHGFFSYDQFMYRWGYGCNFDENERQYISSPFLQFERFFENLPSFGLSKESTTVCFIAHNLFYSNYYYTCQDIYQYSLRNFDMEECYKIQDKLNYILQTLSPLFIILYNKCLEKHFSHQIEMEKYIAEFNQGI